jgi:hypothetical protein
MHAKRTKRGQERHDRGVLRRANWYEARGYTVTADLPGWPKPKHIGGFIPDVLAKRGGEEVVLEVETKDSDRKDRDQHQAFKKYAAISGARRFRKVIV